MAYAPIELNGSFSESETLKNITDAPIENNETTPGRDNKGRVMVECLTDSQKLTEILTILRTTQDAMEGIVASASKNPMFKMLGIKGL